MPISTAAKLAEQFLALYQELDVTQLELSRLLGTTPQAVGRKLQGRGVKRIDVMAMQQLATKQRTQALMGKLEGLLAQMEGKDADHIKRLVNRMEKACSEHWGDDWDHAGQAQAMFVDGMHRWVQATLAERKGKKG